MSGFNYSYIFNAMLCFANFIYFAAKYAVTHFYDVIFIHMNYESHSFKKNCIEKPFDSLIYMLYVV